MILGDLPVHPSVHWFAYILAWDRRSGVSGLFTRNEEESIHRKEKEGEGMRSKVWGGGCVKTERLWDESVFVLKSAGESNVT